MTKDVFTPLETFVDGLRRAYPSLDVSCDVPESPKGSTWIDIRIGGDWTVVEHHPELGFGFSDPDKDDEYLFGTPSSFFVSTAEEALERTNDVLRRLGVVPRDAHSHA